MAPVSDGAPWAGPVSDLLNQASAIMSREGARMYSSSSGAAPTPALPLPSSAGESLVGIAARICPVTGAAIPTVPPDPSRLRQQAHELVAGLFSASGQAGPFLGAGSDGDRLRRQAHEFIETLLTTFGGGATEKRGGADDQVPLLRSAAPVQAGNATRAAFTVTSDEGTPSEVTLYCTDFVSDSGHEIPAMRVTVLPRRATVPAKGEAKFEIEIAVPQQTPAGFYSGLIQAMGNRYVKAVLMVEVA